MARRAALSMDRVLSEAREELRQAEADLAALMEYWDANHCCCCTGECSMSSEAWEDMEAARAADTPYGQFAYGFVLV